MTLEGRRGTTDEFATIPFHLDLFSAALVELAKSISVHSLILSSHLSFCLPLFLFPLTVPCRNVFAKPEDLETWPNHLSFRFLTRVRSSSYSPMAAWIFLRTSSLVTWPLYEMFNSLRYHLISKACVLDSQAYRNTEMTKERISFTFDPRDMSLSLQTGFSFVRAAVACAILERTLWLGAVILNNCFKVLEACYSAQLLLFYLYLSLDAIGTVCHQFGLLRTDLHLIPCAGFVETFY